MLWIGEKESLWNAIIDYKKPIRAEGDAYDWLYRIFVLRYPVTDGEDNWLNDWKLHAYVTLRDSYTINFCDGYADLT